MAYTPAMKVLDCLSQTPVSPINKNSLNPQAPPFLPDKDHFCLSTPAQNTSIPATSGRRTSLSILLMNARSILPKMSELRTVTESVKPDIIAITETWLSSNVPNGAILLPNYNTVARTDRPQDHRGGGVLLLIHDSIQWVLRSDLQTWPESAWIEIHLPLSRSQFVIGCVYRPPSSEVEPFARAMEMTMGNLTDSNALIIGDFNAKCPSWLPSDKI